MINLDLITDHTHLHAASVINHFLSKITPIIDNDHFIIW